MSGPSLKYPGAKWGLAPWIVPYLPPHTTYCEPFFGSGAVFFNKPASPNEYLNDLDGEIVNLFRVMREWPDALAAAVELTPYARAEYAASGDAVEDPVERARRTLVRYWMSTGGRGGRTSGWRHNGAKTARTQCPQVWAQVPERIRVHAQRLKHAQIECRPALELLARLNYSSVLAYVDPPYHRDVRSERMYRMEMYDNDQHAELLEFLAQEWRGMAVVSGYPHPLYDDLLAGWERVERRAAAEMGQQRTEVLWISPAAAVRGLFG